MQLHYLSESTDTAAWSNNTPLQVKVVKTDLYLSKSTEVIAFKST